jgi:hypothetical protein
MIGEAKRKQKGEDGTVIMIMPLDESETCVGRPLPIG